MKKKIFALMMCLTMVLALLASCSGSSEPAEEPADAEPVEVEAVEQRTVYVTPQWVMSALAGEQSGYENIVIANVGYGPVEDSAEYNGGHIKGAIYVDNCEVEDAVGDVEQPYNLLKAEEIRDFLLARGINKDTKVVLYGADPSSVARQAYGYIYCGVEDVKIINGGLDTWTAAGGETETDVNTLDAATDFGCDVPAKPQYWTSMSDALDKLQNDDSFKLVSIRSEQEWLGETSGYSYMDKAGEPQGAVWGKGPLDPYDMSGYMHEDGITTQTLDELKAGLWSDVDFVADDSQHLAFYCGTGWRACIPFLICYQAGLENISVYDGGWYEWMLHDENPVQVGDPASDSVEYTTVGNLPEGKAAN